MFTTLSGRMHQLYFWNMLGSGLGGLLDPGLHVPVPARFPHLSRWSGSPSSPPCSAACGGAARRRGSGSASPEAAALPRARRAPASSSWPDSGPRRLRFQAGKLRAQVPRLAAALPRLQPPGGDAGIRKLLLPLRSRPQRQRRVSRLRKMPQNAFLGMFVDGNGPVGDHEKARSGRRRATSTSSRCPPPTTCSPQPAVLLLRLGRRRRHPHRAAQRRARRLGGGVESGPGAHAARRALFQGIHGEHAGRSSGELEERGGEGVCGLDRPAVRPGGDRADRFDRALTGGRVFGGGELHLHCRGPRETT